MYTISILCEKYGADKLFPNEFPLSMTEWLSYYSYINY